MIRLTASPERLAVSCGRGFTPIARSRCWAWARRLRFIRRAKELGFSLDEIRELLTLSDERDTGVASVRDIAAKRLADVEARLAELMRLRKGLKHLIDACPGHGDPGKCPILNAFKAREAADER